MIKKILIFLTFAILISGAIFQTAYLNSTFGTLDSMAQTIQAQAEEGDFTAAQTSVDELFSTFDHHHTLLAICLEHQELDNLYAEMENLRAFINTHNQTDLAPTFARLRYYIQHIIEMDSLSIGNIM